MKPLAIIFLSLVGACIALIALWAVFIYEEEYSRAGLFIIVLLYKCPPRLYLRGNDRPV
jgi:hypothetical protein